jgi:hypothetical protein
MKKEEKNMFFLGKFKKGISVIIGYLLLVTFAVVIGLIVFQWMKSYVPQDDLNCPDGVSIFIQHYECSLDMLSIDLKNNGKFDIGGYFIYATNSPSQELATIDLSKNNTETSARLNPIGIKFGHIASIIPGNTLEPNEDEIEIYNLTGISNLYSIEILPIRWQKEKNRNVLVSCKDAKISEIIKCNVPAGECVSESLGETCTRVDSECGIEINNCLMEVNCGNCTSLYGSDYECNSSGQCIPSAQCTDTCASLGWICGIVCGNICGTGSCPILNNSIPACSSGACIISSCDSGWDNCDGIDSNGCETNLSLNDSCGSCTNECATGSSCIAGECSTIGNGVCDSGETCAEEPISCEGYQASCLSGNICVSGSCQSIEEGGVGCTNYCISLLHVPPYTSSSCTSNTGQCTSIGGYLTESTGNDICASINPSLDVCCCFT